MDAQAPTTPAAVRGRKKAAPKSSRGLAIAVAAVVVALVGASLVLTVVPVAALPDEDAGTWTIFAYDDRVQNTPNGKHVDVPGNENIVDGDVKSNGDIDVSGDDNAFGGLVRYYDPPYNQAGTGNTYIAGEPQQETFSSVWPGTLGSFTEPACTFGTRSTNTDLDLYTNAPAGVYCRGNGKITVKEVAGFVGQFTILTNREIIVADQGVDLLPYADGLLFYSSTRGIDWSGNLGSGEGLAYAPTGLIKVAGNENSYCMQFASKTFQLSGNENLFEDCSVQPPATLTVVKTVINDNGGTATSSSFTVHVRYDGNNTDVAGSPQPGNAAGTAYPGLLAGNYNVGEDPLPGYQLTISGDCAANGDVVLASGQSKTCTLTNNDVRATLNVTKIVVNDDGGNATAAAWDLFVDATQVANGVPTGFNAGNHVVSEDGIGGYSATFSGDCDSGGNVTLAIGDNKNCMITNNDIRPLLTVTKVVVSDNGGTAQVSDFPLFVDDGAVTSGQQNGFNVGAHQVNETEMAGYQATFSGDCDASGGVSLSPGDVKTCTITNNDTQPLLTVVKMIVNDDGGTAVVEDADLFVDDDPVESGVQGGFDAGTYNVTENGPPGYTPSFGGDCDENGTVTLQVGDAKTCVITNDDIQPLLTVTKVVVNDNGGGAEIADFPLFVDTNGVTSGETNGFLAGSYNVSETQSSAYTAVFSGDCDENGTVELEVGDAKSCTITNDDIQPRLTVVKRVVNDDGGETEIDGFALFVDDESVLSGVSHGFDAGQYNVSETGPGGYAPTFGGDCDANGTVELAAGDDKTCTIVNDDIRPIITVVKVVVNDNGGKAVISDWALYVGDIEVESGQENGFGQGTYPVTEVGPDGYALTYSDDCDAEGNVTVMVGQNKTCTLTNDDVAPVLTVIKIVVNDDGGDATVSAWNLFVDDTQVENGTTNPFNAGDHRVTESGLTGYLATLGGDCDKDGNVTLSIGDNKTCTLTNDDIRPLLTVTKVVVNDNGGTAAVEEFPLFVDDGGVTSGQQNGFDAGAHTVSETGMVGYTATFSDDCDAEGNVNLAPGDVKNCTITNNDVQPLLTVVKMIVNDDGGTAVVEDAELFVDGGNVTSGEQNGFDAGTYNVTESGPAGYEPSFSGDCDDNGTVVLAPGDAKTCVITNDDIQPLLTVTKVVVNDNGGTAAIEEFALFVDDQGVTSGESNAFDAGSHNVSEQGMASYESSFSGDCDENGTVVLSPGDVKSCTITNDDIQAHLTVLKRVINNDGGHAEVVDFLLFVDDGSVQSGDSHGFNAGLHNVTESGPGGYAPSFEGDCDENGTVELAIGDDKTCILVNDDIQPRLTVTKVVVNDNEGSSAAEDFDLFVDATQVTSGAENGFDGGSYVVSESGNDTYALAITGDCAEDGSITLFIGDVKQCTLTNDDIAPEVVCPSDLAVLGNEDGTVTVSWTPAVDSDATRLYRSVDGAPDVLLGEFGAGTTQYVDSDIEQGHTYTYTVTAMFGDEESVDCDSIGFSTIPVFPGLGATLLALLGAPLAFMMLRRRKK